MKTSNCYNKHLDLAKRIKIEKGIEENKSIKSIADDICKSYKTVSNEILKNRNIERCSSWVGKFKTCEKTYTHKSFKFLYYSVLFYKIFFR
ncbi:MAG: helix-turn-helix domain-containing protein [bacterium]|nr:helix-turn-helix domain-containing protein [bacterium]